jgi:hypothetical protein
LSYVDSEYRIEGDSQGVLVALPLTGCTSKRVPLKDAHPLRVTVTNPGQCAHFLDVHVGTDNPHPSSFQDECALLASYHRCRGIKDDVHGRVDAGIRQARSRDSSRRNDIFGYRRQARSGSNISYLHHQVPRSARLCDMHSGAGQHSSVLDGKSLSVRKV